MARVIKGAQPTAAPKPSPTKTTTGRAAGAALAPASAAVAAPTAAKPVKFVAARPTEVPAVAVPAVAAPADVAPSAAIIPAIVPAASTAPVTKQLENAMTNSFKGAEEFVAFSQGNLEAFMKSGQIWTTGLQDLSKTFAATAQASLDETVAAFKALTSVKSVKEAVDLQAALARTSMEKAVAGSSQMADASFKLAEQAMAPITARFQAAASKFTAAA